MALEKWRQRFVYLLTGGCKCEFKKTFQNVHFKMAHRHLLVGDPPPVCVSCQERLSVEHILIHCAEYIDIRVSCFNVNTVRELFDTVPPVLIISFIRRAGLLYLI